MGMKETEGSLRAYFLIAGAVSIAMALRDISSVGKLDVSVLTGGQKAALYLPIATRLLLGCGFVFAGLVLKRALVAGPRWIQQMLVISGAMLFINGALITAELGVEVGRAGITGALIGVAITIYLYRSVGRLAAEARAKAGVVPPPPQAKVV